MAAAAVRGALENVTINLESISDTSFAGAMKSEAQALAIACSRRIPPQRRDIERVNVQAAEGEIS